MFIQYFKGNRIVWLSGDLELIYTEMNIIFQQFYYFIWSKKNHLA